MKLTHLIATCLILLNHSAMAASESHTQAALKLLEVTNSQRLVDGMVSEMKQLLSGIPTGENLSTKQQQLFEDFQANMNSLIESNLSWEKLKPEYAEIYTDSYSEDELIQLTTFYQTSLGKKLLENASATNTALADIPQKHLDTLMTEMQTAAQIVMQEINELKQLPSEKIKTNNN